MRAPDLLHGHGNMVRHGGSPDPTLAAVATLLGENDDIEGHQSILLGSAIPSKARWQWQPRTSLSMNKVRKSFSRKSMTWSALSLGVHGFELPAVNMDDRAEVRQGGLQLRLGCLLAVTCLLDAVHQAITLRIAQLFSHGVVGHLTTGP